MVAASAEPRVSVCVGRRPEPAPSPRLCTPHSGALRQCLDRGPRHGAIVAATGGLAVPRAAGQPRAASMQAYRGNEVRYS